MKTTLVQPLKWHGGKNYLASKIVAMMPPHLHYVEPYFGGGSVMLAKDPEGVSEVANDINSHLTNFWRVLQHDVRFKEFRRLCEATPFSEYEYRHANAQGHDPSDDPAKAAWQFFIRCRQSLAGRMKGFAPLSRTRVRRGMNEQASAWAGAVDGLPEVHQRLRRVAILNHDAVDVIREQDGKDTLFYVDAPYVLATRSAPDVYAHEMTDEQHIELVGTLAKISGKAIVSMYRHPIYDVLHEEHDWRLVEIDIPNNAAGGEKKRRMTECLWMNW